MKSKSFLKDYHLLKRVFARRCAKSICSRFSADIKMSPAKNGSDKKHGAMRHPSLLCLLITWILPPSKRHTVRVITVYKRISILVRIEYRILFALAKLSESNSEYYSCCEIYSNNIQIVQNIRIFEYFQIICNAKMKNFPK